MPALKQLKKIAKDALAVPAVRRTYEGATRGVLEVAGSTRVGATLYSLPGFLTFNREQYAVLSGRRAYYRNLSRPRPSHVELRRNIHRLEKGMIMRPRRDVFARDYILETLDFYAETVGSDIDPVELAWAHKVLTRFFSIVDLSDPTMTRAHDMFTALPSPHDLPTEESVERHLAPYQAQDRPEATVSYEDLLALAQRRRSVRWFQDRPVERELIDKALRVGREAPTACNRLPYEYLVFDDPETVRKVASIPFGAGGYSDQIPTLVVVKGNLSSYFSPRDRHVPYIDASLASMGFMLALETLGLSSSVINWPDFEPLEMKMAKTLGLEPHERVIFLMAVGYPLPEAEVPSSPKKSLSVLRTYDAPVA